MSLLPRGGSLEYGAGALSAAEQVACKLMVWSWKLSEEQRGGLTSRQVIRYQLLRLGIGNELTEIRRGGTRPPLASVEEVLVLRPELRSPA